MINYLIQIHNSPILLQIPRNCLPYANILPLGRPWFFCRLRLPQILRPKALNAIAWHQAQGHEVYIVTASAENWVAPWSQTLNVPCLGSRLEVKNGKVTGLLNGKNCNAAEKVCRIKEALQLTTYATIYAYGDSSGDKEMLAMAQHKGFRHFE